MIEGGTSAGIEYVERKSLYSSCSMTVNPLVFYYISVGCSLYITSIISYMNNCYRYTSTDNISIFVDIFFLISRWSQSLFLTSAVRLASNFGDSHLSGNSNVRSFRTPGTKVMSKVYFILNDLHSLPHESL